MRVDSQWNAWQEQTLELEWPDSWPLAQYSLPERARLEDDALADVLRRGLDAPPVAAALANARSGCVLVDDHTRPVAWARVLARLLDLLEERGLPRTAVTLLVSLAGHAPMTPTELRWKVGEPSVARLVQHSLEGPFTWFELEGRRIGLNQAYAGADFRAALGSLIPHPFAGLSGGAKAVMPGVADLETIRRNHAMATLGAGKVADPANRIRSQMERICAASELHLLVNAAVARQRELVALFAGQPQQAYADGAAFARRWSACPPARKHDVILLNAYPKDRELLQASNAFNVLRTLPPGHMDGVRDVVLIVRAASGLGHHALFGPGGSLYRKPTSPSWMKQARLLVYAPGATRTDVDQSLGGELFQSWSELLATLGSAGGPRDGGFWHHASLQTAEAISVPSVADEAPHVAPGQLLTPA
jgi:nickel-dependent lactate racemase